jgi:hypothetical protein
MLEAGRGLANPSGIPNHNERQLMQQLRGRGWVKGFELPPASAIVGGLLQKGWVEARGAGRGLEYRITEEGMTAKRALIPPWER